jgi:uncharacterized radical SAM superfamily Fe-S cluster-containing enzyme
MILPTGKIRMFDNDLEFWKAKIEHFTSIHKVREIQVSGGEPTIVKWMPDFVKWLLDKGFHVLVLSNGFNADRFLEIPPHYRFQISMTFHHGETTREAIKAKYDALTSLGYRVNIKEIRGEGEKQFDFSWPSVRLCRNADDLLLEDKTFPMLNFGPNGQLYDGCHSMYLDCAVPKDEQ